MNLNPVTDVPAETPDTTQATTYGSFPTKPCGCRELKETPSVEGRLHMNIVGPYTMQELSALVPEFFAFAISKGFQIRSLEVNQW